MNNSMPRPVGGPEWLAEKRRRNNEAMRRLRERDRVAAGIKPRAPKVPLPADPAERAAEIKRRSAEVKKRLYWSDPEAARARSRSRDHRPQTLKKYGITVEDYERMFAEQEGCCAICRKDADGRSLYIDHNHQDGLVRGLLCHQCNVALGLFGDDVQRLRAAAEYLQRQYREHCPSATSVVSQ